VLGSIAVTNSWDMPLYAALLGAGFVTRAARSGRPTAFVGWVLAWLASLAATWTLFHPFFSRFVALVSGVEPTHQGTPPSEYLTHFGVFVGIIAAAVLVALTRGPRRDARLAWPAVSAVFALAAFLGTTLATRTPPVDLRALLLHAALVTALGAGAPLVVATLCPARAPAPWAVPVAVALAGASGALAAIRPTAGLLLPALGLSAIAWLVWRRDPARATLALLSAGATGVTLGADLVFVVDDLRGSPWERMNTVFKFYFEGWTLFALAAAAALLWMVFQATRLANAQPLGIIAGQRHPVSPPALDAAIQSRRAPLAPAGIFVSTLLILGGLCYPLLATSGRLAQRMPSSPTSPTLDGLAWMRHATLPNAYGEVMDLSG
ncbi:MAG: hypothetical protein IRY97_10800, partial [Thermomicrobiaceae bacterium]|nr:hypothetical protein [Thermomicrobiaceae bacterium]